MKMNTITILLLIASVAISNTNNIPSDYEKRKAMNEYRTEHPKCEICGASKSLFRQCVYVRYQPGRKMNGMTAAQLLDMAGLELAAANLPVHHIQSEKSAPWLKATKTNLFTACVSAHFRVCHLGGRYFDHNCNLPATAEALRQAYSNNARSYLVAVTNTPKRIKGLRK